MFRDAKGDNQLCFSCRSALFTCNNNKLGRLRYFYPHILLIENLCGKRLERCHWDKISLNINNAIREKHFARYLCTGI